MIKFAKYWARKLVSKILGMEDRFNAMENQAEFIALLAGSIAMTQQKLVGQPGKLSDMEFKVFSQFGDDGIISFLVERLQIPRNLQTFVEFGVEDYRESNTRFLLMAKNWRGLVLDGSDANVKKIKDWPKYWRYDLTAIASFIDAANINALLKAGNISGEIGLLSVDIDGNDYWVWQAIDTVNPWIVVTEYNSVFGDQVAVTVPYAPNFQRSIAHPSNLFYGASLGALKLLAKEKGYQFVGCNSAGNNSYFVRNDKVGLLAGLAQDATYELSRFRESVGPGRSLLSGNDRLIEIQDQIVWDVKNKSTLPLRDLFDRVE